MFLLTPSKSHDDIYMAPEEKQEKPRQCSDCMDDNLGVCVCVCVCVGGGGGGGEVNMFLLVS